MIKLLILIVTLIVNQVVLGSTIDDATVEYYVDLINDHTEKALEYEFPLDARSYQAINTTIEGKNLFLFFFHNYFRNHLWSTEQFPLYKKNLSNLQTSKH